MKPTDELVVFGVNALGAAIEAHAAQDWIGGWIIMQDDAALIAAMVSLSTVE